MTPGQAVDEVPPREPDFETVLPQYARDRRSEIVRKRRKLLLWILLPCCFIYGFFFAILSQVIIFPFLVPLLFLAGLVIWALPDMGKAPTGLINAWYSAFFVVLILWPNYLAVALPGMPWLTMVRITGFPLLALFLVALSVSKEFRTKLSSTVSAFPLMWKLVVGFTVIQLISIPFSHDMGQSVQKYALFLATWTGIFFISCDIFSKPGRVERWAFVIWMMALILGLYCPFEFRAGHPLWAGHIPSFLKIDDENVQRLLAGQTGRSALGIYRVSGTSSTGLGLAEFVALAIPFVLHFMLGRYPLLMRLAAAATIPLMINTVMLADSRLGMVGCFLALLLSILTTAARRWFSDRSSIFGPAITLTYPATFIAIMGTALTVPRLRAMLLGGGAQQASTDSRLAQYRKGIPLVFKAPLGHGVGQGADTLGFVSPGGVLTIDTYYLAVALEYGVIGFLVFYGMILVGAGQAALQSKAALQFNGGPNTRDYDFLAPITISLMNFFVIKSVFSQQDNHPMVFMMLGIIVALSARLRDEKKQANAETTALAAPPSRRFRFGGVAQARVPAARPAD